MVGFVHFSNFLIPSEKYYNSQSFWITLYYDIYRLTRNHYDIYRLTQNYYEIYRLTLN